MTLEQRILERGLDDWMYLAEVASLVRETRPEATDAELRRTSLETIQDLAGRGLLVLGELTGPGGRFEPWTAPVEESIGRIRTEWETLGTQLSLGDVCWLANTPLGDAAVQGAGAATTPVLPAEPGS